MIELKDVEIQVPQKLAKEVFQSTVIKKAKRRSYIKGLIEGFCIGVAVDFLYEKIFKSDEKEIKEG